MQTIDLDEEIAVGIDAAESSRRGPASSVAGYVQLAGDDFDWESYM